MYMWNGTVYILAIYNFEAVSSQGHCGWICTFVIVAVCLNVLHQQFITICMYVCMNVSVSLCVSMSACSLLHLHTIQMSWHSVVSFSSWSRTIFLRPFSIAFIFTFYFIFKLLYTNYLSLVGLWRCYTRFWKMKIVLHIKWQCKTVLKK